MTKLELFKKFSKKRVFKLTVSTRKFYKKYSKYRRKSFNRLRHKNNSTFYWNIFKFWCQSYQNSKTFYKKYWLFNLFKFNFVTFNINSLKIIENDLFFNENYLLLSFNSFFNFQNNINISNNLIKFNKSYANFSSGSIEDLNELNDQTDLYFFYDFQMYEHLENLKNENQSLFFYNFHNILNMNLEYLTISYLKLFYQMFIYVYWL